jgi:hypothetical protein
MRYCVLLAAAVLACTGCTTLALQHQANTQAVSPTDIRYQEILDNVAMVAENRFALPAYSSIFAGTAQITDTVSVVSATTLGPAMPGQILTPSFTRGVIENWTLDPVNAPEKLEAIRCACRWVICGDDLGSDDRFGLLDTPEGTPCPGRHFGVKARLIQLQQCHQKWLQVGRLHDVPCNVRYKAHSGDTWVWVMPEDVVALADFSLVIQDIARVDINSPTLQYIRPVPSDFLFPTTNRYVRVKDGKQVDDRLPCFDKACALELVPHSPASVIAEVSVDPCFNLMPDIPYYRWRTENAGADANLRSLINASGLH